MNVAERMGRLGTESAFEVLARARALERQGREVVHLSPVGGHVIQLPSAFLALGDELPLIDADGAIALMLEENRRGAVDLSTSGGEGGREARALHRDR